MCTWPLVLKISPPSHPRRWWGAKSVPEPINPTYISKAPLRSHKKNHKTTNRNTLDGKQMNIYTQKERERERRTASYFSSNFRWLRLIISAPEAPYNFIRHTVSPALRCGTGKMGVGDGQSTVDVTRCCLVVSKSQVMGSNPAPGCQFSFLFLHGHILNFEGHSRNNLLIRIRNVVQVAHLANFVRVGRLRYKSNVYTWFPDCILNSFIPK